MYCEDNFLTTLPALPNTLQYLYCESNNITCFPSFPNSITNAGNFSIDPNPYNCLPNYITAMSAADLATPLCAAGNSNGCAVAGIEQYANSNEVSIYPNPASKSLTLTLSKGEGTSIEMYNTIGECVYRQIITSPSPPSKGETYTIDVSDLSEGVYTISISSNEGVINKRFVIVR